MDEAKRQRDSAQHALEASTAHLGNLLEASNVERDSLRKKLKESKVSQRNAEEEMKRTRAECDAISRELSACKEDIEGRAADVLKSMKSAHSEDGRRFMALAAASVAPRRHSAMSDTASLASERSLRSEKDIAVEALDTAAAKAIAALRRKPSHHML